MVLVIDPQIAGISGDMLLCALADMGASRDKIIRGTEESVGMLDGAEIAKMEFRRTDRAGTSALKLLLEVRDDGSHTGGGARHHRKGAAMGKAVRDASARLGLSDAASSYASRCIDILLESESRVHGVGLDSVVFHEASGADTIIDIIGTAIALDDLGLVGGDPPRQRTHSRRIACLPVCVGGGTVSFSHGVATNPAGAILEILKGGRLWMRGSDAGCELTTPTGACMLAALAPDMLEFYPYMQVESIGYGAGERNPDGFANVLKIVRGPEIRMRHGAGSLGGPNSARRPGRDGDGGDGDGGGKSDGRNEGGALVYERICVLETNVDDASGEIIGSLIQKLMDAGAKDVSVCQGLTKKNRPANLISVMCDGQISGRLARLLMSETGTLGVRISESDRIVAPREQHRAQVTVYGRQFEIRYKQSLALQHANPSYGRTAGIKIEFDDIEAVSKSLSIPARDAEVMLREEIAGRMTPDGSESERVGRESGVGKEGVATCP